VAGEVMFGFMSRCREPVSWSTCRVVSSLTSRTTQIATCIVISFALSEKRS